MTVSNPLLKKKLILIVLFLIILWPGAFYADKGYAKVWQILKNKGFFDKEVSLSEIKPGKGVIVALTFGQSNSANSGESLYSPHHKILDYGYGKLYKANDPLIGCGGKGGSVWGMLGDKLIDSGLYKRVVIIPIGMGSTSVTCWADSSCNNKLLATLKELKAKHIRLTHIFWHQGESDPFTTKKVYKAQLSKILKTIRDNGQDAPFYCSIASYNHGNKNKGIISAQREFVKENQNVLMGPDTDVITDDADRFQGIHFTASGMEKYASLWYQSIKESREE